MNDYHITFDRYLIIEDDQITDHSGNGITFANDILTIDVLEKVSLHVVLILHNSREITYSIKDHTQVDLIETRLLDDDVTLKREFYFGADVNVHMFNENASTAAKGCTFVDRGHLARDAKVTLGYAELSNQPIRADYHFTLDEEGADMRVRMAILAKHQEDKYYQVNIEHLHPHTTGIMDNYGVVKDEGRLVIDGIGTIRKGNYGSASHQTNKIMVFDPGCYASANPYLFIDEYDVAASHAAGVGKMDENHLYYLESRGLTKRQSMQLITYGYLIPVVSVIDNAMLKERFEEALGRIGE